jgi:hypothetical protein
MRVEPTLDEGGQFRFSIIRPATASRRISTTKLTRSHLKNVGIVPNIPLDIGGAFSEVICVVSMPHDIPS